MELSWKPEFKDKISKYLFCNSFGSFIGAGISLSKLDRMVHHNQYILNAFLTSLYSKCSKSINTISSGYVLTMLVNGALIGLFGFPGNSTFF